MGAEATYSSMHGHVLVKSDWTSPFMHTLVQHGLLSNPSCNLYHTQDEDINEVCSKFGIIPTPCWTLNVKGCHCRSSSPTSLNTSTILIRLNAWLALTRMNSLVQPIPSHIGMGSSWFGLVFRIGARTSLNHPEPSGLAWYWTKLTNSTWFNHSRHRKGERLLFLPLRIQHFSPFSTIKKIYKTRRNHRLEVRLLLSHLSFLKHNKGKS